MATSSVLLDPVGWQTGSAAVPTWFFQCPALGGGPARCAARRSILVLMAVLAALETGCAGGQERGRCGGAPAATGTTEAGRGNGSGDADTDDVRIVDFAFAPERSGPVSARRSSGSTQDAGVTHSIVALDGGFRSGELKEGDEFSHLFQRAGTAAYAAASIPTCRARSRSAGNGPPRDPRPAGDRSRTPRDGADRVS